MSTVIEFLEQLGNGSIAAGDETAYREAVDSLQTQEELRDALNARDPAALARLLGGRDTMFCLVVPAEDDDEEPARETPDDGGAEEEIRLTGCQRVH